MMIKKIIASVGAAGFLAAQSVAVVAAPVADRTSSPVAESEELAGISTVWLTVLFAALAAGIIILIEEEEDGDIDVLPVSP